ncbi:hypothetical protein HGRIS_014592 [Hohenbuehelia grisea]|uniref:Checkpoint protein RAD24-like helical bundle domain-containing protein n=1 Tax=Hohenbuehelia grisea TaxID=104357 RepID=A0ABR3JUT8_9AGAR
MPPKASQQKKSKSTPKLNILKFDETQLRASQGSKRINPLTAFSSSSSQSQEVRCSQTDAKGKGKGSAQEREKPCNSTRLTRPSEQADLLWVDLYEPSSETELAVHPRKVEDVRHWIKEAFEGGPSGKLRRYRKVLVLTGPAGTAKTTTLRILSREIGFEIVEWRNSADDQFPSEYQAGASDLSAYESSSVKFANFLNRATACRSIFDSTPNASTSRHVILLEDLPNILHSNVQAHFHEALESLVASETSAPVIIIISHAGLRGESEEGSSLSLNQKDGIVDIRTVLPKSMLHGPYVTQIDFNPIAPTLMRKALHAMLNTHFSDSNSRGAPRSKDFIDTVVDSANGDIRSAIMALQFACVLDVPGPAKVKKGKSKSRPSAAVLEVVTRREQSLVLFHLLGKVLYNKRKGDPPNPSATAKDIQKERVLDAALKDPPPLSSFLKEHERPASRVDVDMLYADSPIDSSLFSLYIHQNYPQFCNDVDQCSDIADWLSWADSNGGETWYQANPHRFHLLALGTLHSLPSPVERRSQKLLKPDFFEAFAREKEGWHAVRDVQSWMAMQVNHAQGAQFGAWTQSTIPMELSTVLKASNATLSSLSVDNPLPTSHLAFSRLQFQRTTSSGHALSEMDAGTPYESTTLQDEEIFAKIKSVEKEQDDRGWLEADDIEEF